MFRWSKIPEKDRPEIISDISNDRFYTLVLQDASFRKVNRKDIDIDVPVSTHYASDALYKYSYNDKLNYSDKLSHEVDDAWEGDIYCPSFKNIIDKNIPCVLMHQVENHWCPEINMIVCFMTGECSDVFVVHPKDLTEWDSNEEI